jgi:hypothetical protein
VEYTSPGTNTRLNLQLPATIDKISSTVEAAARQILSPTIVLPTEAPLDITAVLAMNGTATLLDTDVTPAIDQATAREQFKKDIATALFELGITSNNMYVAPTPADQ